MICQEETAQDHLERVQEQEEVWDAEDRVVAEVADKDRAQGQAAIAYALYAESTQLTSRAYPAQKQNAPSADSP